MDQSAFSSKRRQQGAQPTTKPPIRIARDKRQQLGAQRRAATGRIREVKDSNEIIRVPKREDTSDRPSLEDDANARHFTVANVGRNGTLYLKPSRMNPANFTQPPATPPGTSDGPKDSRSDLPNEQHWNEPWNQALQVPRSTTGNQNVPMPPLSLANAHQRRRTRSHSFSTVDESVRSPTYDSSDFQILLNGRDASQRPKSSVDLSAGLLSAGLLDFRIPHYRLGTPRFSDRGTAYLHNSIYSTSEGVRSSVFSRAEYDKLFPAPPGRGHGATVSSRNSSAPFLHPSYAALTPSRTPPTPTSSPLGTIHLAIYDKIESNINDPILVRYSSTTGRITAATPARLIAQITSPMFLDYELLADFFLTFRNFLSCRGLLEYLLARMRWALANNSDAGRIVRVRTFVAIRHWILNYFADDFMLDLTFRQRFCTLVNELAQDLRQRPDRGGTDMNVIGELKKCWRRTCAMFWPVPDALDTSADADILPGHDQGTPAFGVSGISLPLSVQRNSSKPELDFRRSSQIQLPVRPEKNEADGAAQEFDSETEVQRMRTASIPTSPMSDQSLTVLSCSVPFLRSMMLAKDKPNDSRPPGPRKNPRVSEKSSRPSHAHKRSGSFSDALRDRRPPLPSMRPESVDIHSLPSMTFTGGLVRGLLLQPCPSKVNLLIPLSPALEIRDSSPSGIESTYFQERQQQNVGMKKIVGDVRRVLSSRKGRLESPASSHRSTDSSDSKHSGHVANQERNGQPSAWQELYGPPRVDRLGERIESSYKEAFQDNIDHAVASPEAHDLADGHEQPGRGYSGRHDRTAASNLNRMDSHVTTGSRSIVIVDDTGVPDMPVINGRGGALPSVSSWSSVMAPRPFSRREQGVLYDIDTEESDARSGSPTAVASEVQHPSSTQPNKHHTLAVPDSAAPIKANTNNAQARKSSNVHPSALDMPPIRHQLRRRPGGDLKAADNVQDLEPVYRPHTGDSNSTFSQAITSATASHDLSGTHFSGQGSKRFKLQDPYAQEQQKDSLELLPTHSSQPNMRPSFEQQVTHIAQLPERQHDGGIEDALARLEGKAARLTANGAHDPKSNPNPPMSVVARQQHRSAPLHIVKVGFSDEVDAGQLQSPHTDRQGASIYHLSGSQEDSHTFLAAEGQEIHTPVQKELPAESDLPLQGTDFTDELDQTSTSETQNAEAEPSIDAESFDKVNSEPRSGTPKGSFLLDDNESLSDISTEIADQSGDESLGVRSFFFDDTIDDDSTGMTPFRPPPTPPSTVEPMGPRSPERSPVLSPAALENRKPLKEASSAPKVLPSSHRSNPDLQQNKRALRRVKTTPSRQPTAHLPFVVAFESEIIAEQLTIIEKDAIDEVDWKDLISLNWQQTPPHVRNWVDFLKHDANGIDIVIARFNLVVKWAVSECLLTETPSERAKCISKFIHVAAHCLRLRNYASMYQITLALLSSDLARLHQSWALVPPADKQTLERFEKLCQPLRNFHHLRSEMETGID